MQDLDASGLVSLTNALSVADHESEKSAVLLKAIAAGALDLIPSFAPGQAVSLLSSFSCLRHYDEPLYRAGSRPLLAPGLQQLQPRQQANLLLSLARMVSCSSFQAVILPISHPCPIILRNPFGPPAMIGSRVLNRIPAAARPLPQCIIHLILHQ